MTPSEALKTTMFLYTVGGCYVGDEPHVPSEYRKESTRLSLPSTYSFPTLSLGRSFLLAPTP